MTGSSLAGAGLPAACLQASPNVSPSLLHVVEPTQRPGTAGDVEPSYLCSLGGDYQTPSNCWVTQDDLRSVDSLWIAQFFCEFSEY